MSQMTTNGRGKKEKFKDTRPIDKSNKKKGQMEGVGAKIKQQKKKGERLRRIYKTPKKKKKKMVKGFQKGEGDLYRGKNKTQTVV